MMKFALGENKTIAPFDFALPRVRAIWAGGCALAGGWAVISFFPSCDLDFFAAGTARLVGVLTGLHAVRIEEGWLLPNALYQPVVVSAACSATHYFVMVSALLSAQFARKGKSVLGAVLIGSVVAIPLSLFINAVRVVTVIQVYRWLIPHLPASYASFLHTLMGVAVFLPCLIALNLLVEKYGSTFCSDRD